MVERWRASRGTGEPFETEYRLRARRRRLPLASRRAVCRARRRAATIDRLVRDGDRHRRPQARRGAPALPRRSRLGARQLARLRADAQRRRAARRAADRRLVRRRHLRRTAGSSGWPSSTSTRSRWTSRASCRRRCSAASAAAGAAAIRRASRCSSARSTTRRSRASARRAPARDRRARSRRARTSRVPLVARGEVFGAISLVTAESERVYGEDDLTLAQELARHAAAAIDNARLYAEAERRGRAARALEAVGDGVVLVDREGVIRLWNTAAAAITGVPEEDVLGKRIEDVIQGWNEISPRIPVASKPGEPVRAETVPVEFGGRELWISGSGVGFEEGTVYAFRDLTEERALEEMKAEFVATVSHELRTPLAAIYGSAQTIRRTDIELAPEIQDQLLGVIASESDRLGTIVNDLLHRQSPRRGPAAGRDRELRPGRAGGRGASTRPERISRTRSTLELRAPKPVTQRRRRPRPAAPGARQPRGQRDQVLAGGRRGRALGRERRRRDPLLGRGPRPRDPAPRSTAGSSRSSTGSTRT